MAILPQPPCRGQAITADLIRAIIDAVRAIRPLQGPGIRLQEGPNGTIISATAAASRAAVAAAKPQPFQCAVAIDAETGTATLRVRFGRVFLLGEAQTLATPSAWTRDTEADDPATADWLAELDLAGGTAGDNDPWLWRDAAGAFHLGLKSEMDDAATPLRHLAEIDDAGAVSQIWVGNVWLDAVGDAGDQLGPIVRETVEGKARIAQYLGRWRWVENAADPALSQWLFEKKQRADGTFYPPAHVYANTLAKVAVRTQSLTAGADEIRTLEAPLLFLTEPEPAAWLTQVSAELHAKLTYTPPADETGTGALTAAPTTLTFFGSKTEEPPETLLQTEVEEVNETTTHETASGAAGGE